MTSKGFIPDPQDPSQEVQVAVDIQIDPSIRLQIREMEAILARINKEFSHRIVDQTESEDESYIKPTLSIHSNAQARYLVEEWEGGTVCDMTGKARKIEVEFHCGSDGVDSIVGVKEISTRVPHWLDVESVPLNEFLLYSQLSIHHDYQDASTLFDSRILRTFC